MTTEPIPNSTVPRRISAAVGGAAMIAAFAVTIQANSDTPTTAPDAHAKFQVVTVIAAPASSPPATVTETDKPHQLAITKATPDIRTPRTILARP
jgi:hypothetical protein